MQRRSLAYNPSGRKLKQEDDFKASLSNSGLGLESGSQNIKRTGDVAQWLSPPWVQYRYQNKRGEGVDIEDVECWGRDERISQCNKNDSFSPTQVKRVWEFDSKEARISSFKVGELAG